MVVFAALGTASCGDPILSQAAQAAFEDRKTGVQIDDASVTTTFLKNLVEKDKKLVLDVSLDMWEGRALLTGTLESDALRSEIEKMLTGDKRVKKIYNEVLVVSKKEVDQRRQQQETKSESKGGFGQTVSDVWIGTKIKAQLVSTRGITSVNYRWRSVNNTVYIIGRARSQQELDQVLGIIKQTEGVKRVKSYVVIKLASQD